MMSTERKLQLPDWLRKYVKETKFKLNADRISLQPSVSAPQPSTSQSTGASEHIFHNFYQISGFAEKLLLKAEKEHIIIGIDLDWPCIHKVFSKTSQIHICHSNNECCILKVHSLKVLPQTFTRLLKHPNITLKGYSIQSDLQKLAKDFGFDIDPIIAKLAAPGNLSNDQLSCFHNWDLQALPEQAVVISKTSQSKKKNSIFKFEGCIKYSNDFSSCEAAARQILEVADSCSDDEIFTLGLDAEWPWSHTAGSGKLALIPISPDKNLCYLLHVSKFESLPESLIRLLNHKHVKLAGVNIANDIKKIGRDFNIEVSNILENIIDLSSFANEVLNVSKRWWSLSALVSTTVGKELPKPRDVRCSSWDEETLSEEQIHYAATDAYAGLAVYNELVKRKEEKKL